MRNSLLKLGVVVFAVATAIAFGVLYAQCGGDVNYGDTPSAVTRCKRITGAAAVCECTCPASAFPLLLPLFSWTDSYPPFPLLPHRVHFSYPRRVPVDNLPGSLARWQVVAPLPPQARELGAEAARPHRCPKRRAP